MFIVINSVIITIFKPITNHQFNYFLKILKNQEIRIGMLEVPQAMDFKRHFSLIYRLAYHPCYARDNYRYLYLFLFFLIYKLNTWGLTEEFERI